jgi:hypothetical protein
MENYCEKYVPLQNQNAISEFLHGFVSPAQKVRLEDYEMEVYSKLHKLILDDNGEPHLEQVKESIIETVTIKLDELQALYKERHMVEIMKTRYAILLPNLNVL